MATAAPHSLRDRMSPPRRPRPLAPGRSASGAEVGRVLALAAGLFEVSAAALVLGTAEGLAVEGVSGPDAEVARDAACRLFEALAAAAAGGGEDAGRPRGAGVLEELVQGRGFVAAAPVLSPGGRCLGALCLVDAGRHALLSGLQRRLLAELGDLLAPRLGDAGPARDALQSLADAESDAFALFDRSGRCLLRNARFEALLGTASPAPPSDDALAAAPGLGADWLAARIMRDLPPVGVYRAALADGAWMSIEERRGPLGRSLIARVESGEGFGGADAQLLFERCPLPMFVFDRDTRAVVAVNAAALSFYGWDRDAFLRLDVDGIGPAPLREGGAQAWVHRARDGRALPVSGHAVALAHRGRPAVLVTVLSSGAAVDRAA